MKKPIHVSDLALIERCPRLAWNSFHHIASLEPVVYAARNEDFYQIIKEFLHIPDVLQGKAWDTSDHSASLLEKHGYGMNLRFEYEEIRTKIPVLIELDRFKELNPDIQLKGENRTDSKNEENLSKCDHPEDEAVSTKPDLDKTFKESDSSKTNRKGYAAIYPVCSLHVREHELVSFWLNRYLACKAGIDIQEHYIVTLDGHYIRQELLDPASLLTISRHLHNRNGRPCFKTIDEQLSEMDLDFEKMAKGARKLFEAPIPEANRISMCSAPRKCALYGECFPEDDLNERSSAYIRFAKRKNKENVPALMQDLHPEDIDGFARQYAQIMAAKNPRGEFVDLKALQNWLSALKKPFIYLDFEWDTYSIPPYVNMKPFDVLCFQYSAHIEQDGKLEHYSFFEGGDCRRDFIESLIKTLPETGSIIVYNMEGAEKLRLIQLGRQFPEYAQKLNAFCERMIDLSVLFEQGAYYNLAQRGHFSLKKVLPLFASDNPYEMLPVHNGLLAIHAYRKHEKEENPAEKQKLAAQISEYCKTDTLAEVIILHGLRKLLEKRSKDKKR